MKFEIRNTTEKDLDTILEMVYELAEYEKMKNEVVVTKEKYKKVFYDLKSAYCLLMYEDDKAIGYIMYYYNFSSFLGKMGLYLEDLYVRKQYRHKGYGKQAFKRLAQIAIENDCDRFEWCVLNWNEPSINFYKSLNATAMDEWTTYRLTTDDIKLLAKN